MSLLALAACSAEASLAGKYHIEQDGYGFGPGAEKITLDLNTDKTFAVQAGPKFTLVEGTWQAKDKQITFSKESGNHELPGRRGQADPHERRQRRRRLALEAEVSM